MLRNDRNQSIPASQIGAFTTYLTSVGWTVGSPENSTEAVRATMAGVQDAIVYRYTASHSQIHAVGDVAHVVAKMYRRTLHRR